MANCTKEQSLEMVEKYLDREFNRVREMDLVTRENPITLDQCEKELQSLLTRDLNIKTASNIVNYFNDQSLIRANKKGKDSPYDYWIRLKKDKELFSQFLENRYRCSDYFKDCDRGREDFKIGHVPDFIYGIGLSTSTKAPRVSYFKPALMKYIVKKYAKDYNEIFDPFSGFAGRLLGTLVCGKKYIGSDISDLVIEENAKCAEWLKSRLPEAEYELRVKDAFNSNGSYQCLITCPPYGIKKKSGRVDQIEQWRMKDGSIIDCEYNCDDLIDKVLENYSCDRYIFIVDETVEKYKDFIVEKFENVNYINARQNKLTTASRNRECLVIIERGLLKWNGK